MLKAFEKHLNLEEERILRQIVAKMKKKKRKLNFGAVQKYSFEKKKKGIFIAHFHIGE